MLGIAVRICLLDSLSRPSNGITSVTIFPDEFDSGTTILNDLENSTSPTSSNSGIFSVNALSAEIKVSSPTL